MVFCYDFVPHHPCLPTYQGTVSSGATNSAAFFRATMIFRETKSAQHRKTPRLSMIPMCRSWIWLSPSNSTGCFPIEIYSIYTLYIYLLIQHIYIYIHTVLPSYWRYVETSSHNLIVKEGSASPQSFHFTGAGQLQQGYRLSNGTKIPKWIHGQAGKPLRIWITDLF